MSALRKAGVWLGLVEDDEEDLYDDPDPVPEGRAAGRGSGGRARDQHDDYEDEEPLPAVRRGAEVAEPPVVPRSRGDRSRGDEPANRSVVRDSTVSYLTRDGRMRDHARRDAGRDTATRDNLALAPQVAPEAGAEPERRYQITTLHPTTYREARTIGEHFREGTPVIMNLTEMDEADARRLVDFGAGLAFGLRGTMERVTNRVFLLSPADVQVTPEDKARIAGGGFLRPR
jgi:cell division inhibitor SepF